MPFCHLHSFIPPTFTMQPKRRSHQRVYADIIFFASSFSLGKFINIGIPCIVTQKILCHKHNPLIIVFQIKPSWKIKTYRAFFLFSLSGQ